jgi:hypothetical protein
MERRKFTREFKLEAVWLIKERGAPLCGPPPTQNGEYRHGAERDKDDHDNLIPHRMSITRRPPEDPKN